jgi:putative colanic acid biosynthesis acetyltransferase WcaF
MTRPVANDTYNNDWYRKEIGASKIKQILWYLTNAVFFINPVIASSGLKARLLRLFGAEVGVGVRLKPGINIKYPWKLSIGDHAWVGERVWIDNLGFVRIGKNVCLSQGAFLLTGNHDYTSSSFDLMVKEIVLEEGVWIGAKAIVCPGVVCGTHAVLAAGSVATGPLERYMIYQGNPAVIVRERKIIK